MVFSKIFIFVIEEFCAMKKHQLLLLAIPFFCYPASAQKEQPSNIYVNDRGEVFVKADSPVYFFISPENQPNQKVMIPSTDKAANPMYFDGDGKHYLVYESKGENMRFLVWADGVGPKSGIMVTNGLLFNHTNRIYVEDKATFSVTASDAKSGTKETYFAIDELPFTPAGNGFTVERTGEYNISVFAIDNVGNIGDTATFRIVAAPDITFKVNNIYFETASARITGNSFDNLKEIVDILKNYPELYVEINAHADTRGLSDYNLELSQKRAQAVVNYLITKEISSARLKAKGFGDSKPVNECVKGVNCPENRHRENRRVEFRFYLPKQKP